MVKFEIEESGQYVTRAVIEADSWDAALDHYYDEMKWLNPLGNGVVRISLEASDRTVTSEESNG